MGNSLRLLACATVSLALLAGPARAADQMLFGKLFFVKNNLDPAKRKVKYLAKEIGGGNTVQGNPMTSGATFEVVMVPLLGTGSQQCFSLPASGWSPISAIGYKYKDATGANGPIKVASIKRTPSGVFLLKVVGNGLIAPITVEPPTRTAQADTLFRISSGDRYCSTFGGTFLNDGVSQFKAKDATDPIACGTGPLVCSPSGAFLD
jgi:hypothetical protein